MSMRDNETTLKFTWKTFEVKNHGPTTNKKFPYEEQSRCTWIYLTQDFQSLTDYLTRTFSPHHHAFIFKNMFGVLSKLDLDLLLETPSRRRWVFTQIQMIERWMFNELNLFFFSENSLKDWLEDLYEILLESKQPRKGKRTKSSRHDSCSLFCINRKFSF